MIYLWFTFDLHMLHYSRLTRSFTRGLTTHSAIYLCSTYVLLVIYLWFTNDLLMIYLCSAYDLLMIYLWFTYGLLLLLMIYLHYLWSLSRKNKTEVLSCLLTTTGLWPTEGQYCLCTTIDCRHQRRDFRQYPFKWCQFGLQSQIKNNPLCNYNIVY